MDEQEVLRAERACERLTYRYTHLVDFGHASKLPDLFTLDGVFDNGDLHLEGRAQLIQAFIRREKARELRTRHVCTNVVIDVRGPTTADGVVYLSLYRQIGPTDWAEPVELSGPSVVGSYHDEYAKVDDTWLISRRLVQMPFVSATDVPWTTTIK